jgi:hypothetical protein
MKHHFVKTDNFQRLLSGINYMENRGSATACLCLLHGEPGVGKTRNISKLGPDLPAVMIKGHVGMNLDGLIWSVSQGLGIKHSSNRTQEIHAQVAALAMSGTRIILDEAQFGLYMRHNGRQGAGIEYLRDICERGNTFAVLICHESEVAGFSESEHIRTRIGHRIPMFNASLVDTTSFVRQLCEVATIDDEVGAIVHQQTAGKYRLVENAISTLEAIARKAGLTHLTAADLPNLPLVVDHEANLVPKAVKSSVKTDKKTSPTLAVIKGDK